MDLCRWAVLVSQPEIAKLLWSKTDQPLRMAVYASLLCRKMTTGMDEGIEKDELDEQAAMYEDWAMELLEEAEEDAPTLLLGLPLAYIPDPEDFEMLWSDSVLEAAIGTPQVRCLRFISHRLCKQIVYNIFSGFVYQLQPWKTLLKSLPAEDLKVLYGEEEVSRRTSPAPRPTRRTAPASRGHNQQTARPHGRIYRGSPRTEVALHLAAHVVEPSSTSADPPACSGAPARRATASRGRAYRGHRPPRSTRRTSTTTTTGSSYSSPRRR